MEVILALAIGFVLGACVVCYYVITKIDKFLKGWRR